MARRSFLVIVFSMVLLITLVVPSAMLAQGPGRATEERSDALPASDLDSQEQAPLEPALQAAPVEPDMLSLRPAVPVPQDEYSGQAVGDDPFCLRVYDGTVRSTWLIENPLGLGLLEEQHYANYDQNILSRTGTRAEIELVSRAYIDTTAPYPVDWGTMPSWAAEYIAPAPMAQSDHPEIVALAQSLVQGAESQAEAVEQIQAWVRSQIAYDYTVSLPNNALDVLRQRSGVCSGYSWLTIALLRAVSIPARYYVGCVAWYGEQGGLHAWVEIFYPDAGWVVSEPQSSANYLHTAGYIMGALGICDTPSTTITQLSLDQGLEQLVSLETPYLNKISFGLNAASSPTVERQVLSVTPHSDFAWASLFDTDRFIDLWIKNNVCWAEDWQVASASPWLRAARVEGLTEGLARINYDVTGLAIGRYSALLDVYASRWDLEPSMTVVQDFWMTKLNVINGSPWLYDFGAVSTDSVAGGWPSSEATPRDIGDVNGDGLADLAGFGIDGTYVALSDGDGFEPPTCWIRNYGVQAGGWASHDLFPRMLGDVNGDGRDDVVGFSNKATYVSLSTGSAFGASTPWIMLYGPAAGGWDSQNTFPRMMGDVNGDGMDDIVAFGNRATYVSLSTGSSFAEPDPWVFAYGSAAGGWTNQNIFARMLGM